MRLTDLEPTFLKYAPKDGRQIHIMDVPIAEADGVQFLCPKCVVENKGPIGTHAVLCWSPTIPQTVSPKPGRWNLVGAGFEDLSLVAGSSSVLLTSGCKAHFLIVKGEVIDC